MFNYLNEQVDVDRHFVSTKGRSQRERLYWGVNVFGRVGSATLDQGETQLAAFNYISGHRRSTASEENSASLE